MKPDWLDNTGRRPRNSKGRRVRVQLRGDDVEPYEPVYESDRNPMVKLGWAADDQRWTFSRDQDPCRRFDIIRYRFL